MDLKKQSYIDAWVKTFGNVTQTCQIIGISRQTHYEWIETDPEFKAAIESAQPLEIKLDFIENKLVKKIEEGDTACLIFVAKTLGKKRGYVERTEIDATVNLLKVEIVRKNGPTNAG